MADRPEMFGPTRGFSGMADSMEPCKMLWADPCCHGKEIWVRRRDPVPYRLVCLIYFLNMRIVSYNPVINAFCITLELNAVKCIAKLFKFRKVAKDLKGGRKFYIIILFSSFSGYNSENNY